MNGDTQNLLKNVVVANWKQGGKASRDELEKLLRAQIENSIEIGWQKEDIIAVTNFPFEFEGVKARQLQMPDFCLTGSKMFAVQCLLRENPFPGYSYWLHDLDCWQNISFDIPTFKDVGVTHYSRPKINGGSIFWRISASDLVEEIVDALVADQSAREEPTLQRILGGRTDRVTILDSTFNVGCSGFVPRCAAASKPIRVCHLHPTNRIAWETHTLDRNGTGLTSVNPRLNSLLRRYWSNLAIELQPDGLRKQQLGREQLRSKMEAVRDTKSIARPLQPQIDYETDDLLADIQSRTC